MAYCTCRGLRLYYVDVGEGSPVVLLHPAPLDHTIWLYQIPLLSDHLRVLALDQRCFGRSEKPEHVFDIAEFGADLEAFLDVLGIPSAHIVGMSLGGIAAQLLALNHHSRVKKMVLVGTTAITTTAAFVKERLERFRSQDFAACYQSVVESLFGQSFRGTALGRYLVGTFVERGGHLNRASVLRFYEALQHLDITDAIHEIRTPTLVVAGTDDVTYNLSRRVAEGIPGAKFVPMEGYGRSVPLEAPQQFTPLVSDFLLNG